MAGEVLNMSDLTINKHWCKLKDLCSKTATNHILNVPSQSDHLIKSLSKWQLAIKL